MRYTRLADWLTWLEQAHPREIDLGLERVGEVARRLALATTRARVISVAGTNGKGSCVSASTALLLAAGWSVGSYTSPHLLHYRERIRINGEPVDDEAICRAFAAVDEARAELSLTYFEFGTLAALWLFREHDVDALVLEVGLGGRLDAVNIIDADVAVVTSIALDHQDWLGADRDAIGREKAGIARAGRPLVCVDPDPPEGLRAAVSQSRAQWLPVAVPEQEPDGSWYWRGYPDTSTGAAIQVLGPFRGSPLPLASIAAAIQAVVLLGVAPDIECWRETLGTLRLPGRYYRPDWRLAERVDLVLDVAHNPAATAYLAGKLAGDPVNGSTRAVVAMMADKDIPGTLEPLTGLIDCWYLAELSGNPRAAAPERLASALTGAAERTLGGSVADNLARALAASAPGDRVLVLGSFFTVADALAWGEALGEGEQA
ncbi:bifunctional tetrahydrofolate synthase/dihydrofolate synthase [Marinimicrobium alkaliphilum]|uniref:bifunctional tetrahydrofolate synthase/dihydrofolate synthase n=1 Tax=Marinimicrobium alkaliphilum TaxID=2202654 RepID=UPI000DB93FD0|nr:bifunctional tetrahydrofolate synthase/dihydrofolate synthase [Marinimicrobium alkaliphilum]